MSRLPKWRPTQTALLKLVIALVFLLVSIYSARSQEFPPADPASAIVGDGVDGENGDVAIAEVPQLSESARTAIRVVEARNPTTATELLTSANVLRRVEAYQEAKSYLTRAKEAATTDDALAQLHSDLGTVELIRLANDQAMMPEGRDFVFEVFAAAKRVRTNPNRLSQVITNLASEDEETRRVAMFKLSQAGAHAVPPLLDALRGEVTRGGVVNKVSLKRLDQAINSLGVAAEDALIAAVGAPDSYVQSIAARALGNNGTDRAKMSLIRPYFSGRKDLSKNATDSLTTLGGKYPTDVNAAATYLRNQAKRHLAGEPPVRPEYDGTLEMWTWSAEKKNVVAHRVTGGEAAAIAAARMARDAYELNATDENQQLLLISQLQADRTLNGMDNALPQGPGTGHDFGKSRGPDVVSNALGRCLEAGYHPAASGAAELLGDISSGQVSGGKSLTPLVRALQSPDRRVRYAAARAIMKIDPRHAYAGASYLLEALVDLADATGQPRAIVAGPNTNTRNKLAGMLGGVGFNVFQAKEGNSCLKEALRISDYDLIVLSDSTSRPTAGEVIQQLRKSPRGKLVPVILLARPGQETRTEAIAALDAFVITMPEFGDELALRERLEQVEQIVGNLSVPPARRLLHARDALLWLGHMAKYSKTYPWYDTMRAGKVATLGVGHPVLREAAIDLLGYQGDESAQKKLLETASRSGHTVETRQQAANAFGEAVLRRGLMLRKSEVYSQYDRYNAAESEDEQTQEILGQLLDIIETQTRPKPVSTTPVF